MTRVSDWITETVAYTPKQTCEPMVEALWVAEEHLRLRLQQANNLIGVLREENRELRRRLGEQDPETESEQLAWATRGIRENWR